MELKGLCSQKHLETMKNSDRKLDNNLDLIIETNNVCSYSNSLAVEEEKELEQAWKT